MNTHPPRRRILTPSGRTLLAVAVGSYSVGWLLGWTELLTLATGLALILVLAVPFVMGRQKMSVRRRLDHELVSVGDEISAAVVIVNSGRSHTAPVVIEEHVGQGVVEVGVPSLATGGVVAAEHECKHLR